MLKNDRVTAFTVSELFLENQHVWEWGMGRGGGKITSAAHPD